MFKLLKLATYGLAGYALYQIYLGISDASSQRVAGRELERDLGREDQGRAGTLSGGGRGSTEQTEESSGMSASHKVGRGASI